VKPRYYCSSADNVGSTEPVRFCTVLIAT